MKVELVFRPAGTIYRRGYISHTVNYCESLKTPEIGELVAFKNVNDGITFQVISKQFLFSEDDLTIEYAFDLPTAKT